jgi:hypothetical protein
MDMETSSISPYTQDSTLRGTAAIVAVILQQKFGRDSTLLLYTIVFDIPSEKVVCGCSVRTSWGTN